MSTEEQTVKQEPEKPVEPVRTFSQEEVDAIISKRLKEDRATREREAQALKEKEDEARRIATLQGEEKLKAEYEAKLKEQSESMAEIRRQLAVTRAQSKLASAGLPIDLAENVLGRDDEETDARIASLSKTVTDLVAAQVQAGLNHGTPPAGAAPSSNDAKAAELDRIMGITR